MKQYNYVYIITNLINKKQYIGDHSTNNLEKDYYFGGGLILKRATKKYGKKNFKKEILEFFPTKKDAFNAQEKYIQQFNTLMPDGYNISPAGGLQCSNGWSEESREKQSKSHLGKIPWNKGKNHSEESIQKMRESHKGHTISEEHAEKLHNSTRGKPAWNKGLKGYRKNYTHSPETRKKIGDSSRGRKQSEETKEKRAKKLRGRKRSKETIEKIVKANTGRKASKETIQKLKDSHFGQIPWNKDKKLKDHFIEKHGEKEGLIIYNKYVLKQGKNKKGKPAPIKGRKAIVKDNQKKYVTMIELQKYIDSGWKLLAKKR